MRHLAPLLLASTVLTAPAIAWNEPETFRGVPWGASEETLTKQIPGDCMASPDLHLAERICSSSFTIGDVPTKALLWFRSGGFVGVRLAFDPRQFFTVEAAFRERYGPPTNTRNEPGRTKGGLEFVNVQHEWQGVKIYISLDKYGGRITESRAIIQTVADREEELKYIRQRGKKGAGDL
jgi:hypothetical protein